MNKRNTFFLYGEGSFLNKGCEAIVNTTVKKIKKAGNNDIILATNDIEYDSKFYNKYIDKYVKQVYKDDELTKEEKEKLDYFKTIPFDYSNFEQIYYKDCIAEINKVDICISVGGDNYCYGEPNWLYTINKSIKNLNKKNVFWCTSLFEEITSDEMIRDLKTYDVIMARETLTYNALSKYIDKDRLILTPDSAFSLDKKEVELPKIFKESKKTIGINISPLVTQYTKDKENFINSIKTLIDYILKDKNYGVCLIPHVYIKGNNDLDTLRTIKEIYQDDKRVELLDDRIYDCEELKYIISNCNLLVAARTHASIAGYSTIVPTLVIGYSVKSKGIALDLFGNYEDYVIPVDKITPDILVEKFQFIQKNSKKIKDVLNEKIPIYKQRADNQIIELLERLNYLDKKAITDKFKCTGCLACYNACPHDAITIKKDEYGFSYPEIDKEKCTGCNLCQKVCPANKVYSYEYESPKFYAAINKKEEERLKSSSGGVMAVIAGYILGQKGIVYGAALQENKVKHIRVSNHNDLFKIMGSKYVQSDISLVLRQVKDDLQNNKKVLFTGTPCQIEGLKSYLNKDYSNLICMAIFCHGVPSPAIFNKHIKEKEKENKERIIDVNFRNKTNGWHNYSYNYSYENGKNEMIPFNEDLYMKGYLKNYFLRDCCYNCQMRYGQKNTADLIIGDFWGIENVMPEIDDNKGVSAVIINTLKGKNIFDMIKNKLVYKSTTFEDILRANPVLKSSVKYSKNKDVLLDLIKNNEYYISMNYLNGFELKKEIDLLQKEKEYLLGQIELKNNLLSQKQEELNSVYTSKRWKYTDKFANTIRKLRGK